MHKAILGTVRGRDETEPLRIVEPLDRAGRTHCELLMVLSLRSPGKPYVRRRLTNEKGHRKSEAPEVSRADAPCAQMPGPQSYRVGGEKASHDPTCVAPPLPPPCASIRRVASGAAP